MDRLIIFALSICLLACGSEVHIETDNPCETTGNENGDCGTSDPKTTLNVAVANQPPGQVILPGTEEFYIYQIYLTATGGGVEVKSIRYERKGLGAEDDWGNFHVQIGVNNSSEETLDSEMLKIPIMMSIPESVTVNFGLYGDVLPTAQAYNNHYFAVRDKDSITTDADLVTGDFPLTSNVFTIGSKPDPHCDVEYLGPNADNGMVHGATGYHLVEFSILCNEDFTVRNTYLNTGAIHPPGMEMVNPNQFLNNIRIVDTDTNAVVAGPGSFLSDTVFPEDYELKANVQRNLAFVVDVDDAMPPDFQIQGGIRFSDGVGPNSYFESLNYFLPITGLSQAGTSTLVGQLQTTN